jgi:hypothetical protein
VPGWLAGASVPPVVALSLDPAVVVAWSFVDPLFGLATTALEAVVDCAVVGSAWAALGTLLARGATAIIAWTLARGRERLDLCE